jgi:hypothetical protein
MVKVRPPDFLHQIIEAGYTARIAGGRECVRASHATRARQKARPHAEIAADRPHRTAQERRYRCAVEPPRVEENSRTANTIRVNTIAPTMPPSRCR